MPFLPAFDDEEDQFGVEGSSHAPQDAPDQRVRVAVRALRQMQQQLANVLEALDQGDAGLADERLFRTHAEAPSSDDQRVVEGVFDGERMLGTDGMKYNVPPNYASKSKLVEGDIMKLIIKTDGSFIFKQIGPVDRERLVGTLAVDDYGNYAMQLEDGRALKILTASVTYYKGQPGDQMTGLVPKGRTATWAAVENILQ